MAVRRKRRFTPRARTGLARIQRARHRKALGHLSDRSFQRYWWALRMLVTVRGEDGFEAALKRATRPNGSLNVSALEREALAAFSAWRAPKGQRV